MVFSSLVFLFGFLPLTIILYYLAPRRQRNVVLLLLSLFFYGWGEPTLIWVMLLSLTLAYFLGFFIGKYKEIAPKRAKFITILSVAISLSFLFFFKYYLFLARNLASLFQIGVWTPTDLRLPIGISFYTFQIISYTVDLCRGDCNLQKNYVSFGAYVTLFPQLIAGPIVRYRDIDVQLAQRKETLESFSQGVVRFCIGLSKKVLLGDALALWGRYFEGVMIHSPSAISAWMAVVLFTLHLYYDFSGYSDMAIGLGRMFGFSFVENFNYPYISRSITEFWRRWHISLSTWFREYVYIPLGGNRRGKWRTYRNLAIVWLMTGFWHGANWNFLLWGAYYAVILIVEKAFLLNVLKRMPSPIRHLYTILFILFGFLIFHFEDVWQIGFYFKEMIGIGIGKTVDNISLYQLRKLIPLLFIAVIGCTPYPKNLVMQLFKKEQKIHIAIPLYTLAIFLLCIAYLVDSTFSPFAYLQF